MRLIFKTFLILPLLAIIGVPLAAVAVVLLAFDAQPLLTRTAEIKPENIARARRIIERNDPRKMKPGTLRGIVIGNEDLDLALNYLANRYARGSAQVVLREGGAQLRASLALPANPLGKYVNLDAAFSETSGLPQVESLRVGRIPVPGFLARQAMAWGLAALHEEAGYGAAADAVKHVALRAGALRVEYEWTADLPEKLKGVLVSKDDEARLKAYQARLVQITGNAGNGPMPLENPLRALLQLAAERASAASAAAENRAALVTLAFFVNGRGLAAVIPAARDWPRPAPRNVTLAGRHDSAQHYSVSAALAAAAGSPLADAVGLYKELEDSRGGSGFSFNDLAADRAGTRFGELATTSAVGAQKVQSLARDAFVQAVIYPNLKDLPEDLQEDEFKRRFGGVGGVAYTKMAAEIERRVAALAIFR